MGSGRQLAFDRTVALDQAMRVFWVKGYAGTSLADLTTAMGINKPSLYATFGNKEALFTQCTRHYIEHYASRHFRWLEKEELPIKERLTQFLLSAIQQQASDSTPPGCFMVVCTSEVASENIPEKAMAALIKAQEFAEHYLTTFFQTNLPQAKGDRVATVTLYVLSILHGTAALTRGGKTVAELKPVVKLGMEALDWLDS